MPEPARWWCLQLGAAEARRQPVGLVGTGAGSQIFPPGGGVPPAVGQELPAGAEDAAEGRGETGDVRWDVGQDLWTGLVIVAYLDTGSGVNQQEPVCINTASLMWALRTELTLHRRFYMVNIHAVTLFVTIVNNDASDAKEMTLLYANYI